MKKSILLFVAVAIFGLTSFAQKPIDSNPFSLEGGVSLNALTGGTFTAPVLKLRYFVNNDISARLGVAYSSQKNVDIVYGTNDAGFQVESKSGTLETKNNNTTISIGAAYHFSEFDKLSPYAAVDLSLVSSSNSSTWTSTDINGAAYDENRKGLATTSASGFGVFVGAGVDYYFSQNIFIGVEVGFSLVTQKAKPGQFSETIGATTTTIDTFSNNNNSVFQNASSNFIRIGWRF